MDACKAAKIKRVKRFTPPSGKKKKKIRCVEIFWILQKQRVNKYDMQGMPLRDKIHKKHDSPGLARDRGAQYR